ncbi:response regulator transcription factor [Psychrobacillus lasiicapitis]|uniref:Response regulator transcription factor n=1 Tax=Psychrobacillus lasiicapitis TaxID=1636719 RepID=A0A544T4X4_9BACI|nr:response regulator transcription factor [Psychrobacillus lasiicapitis]TQR12479.1 response regulator transcription factor [Psychrobacillus lasiicapitis]GGA38458.1 DNA-binding response regulator [Psychrobacillus lasiicapitis]
MIEVLIVDDHPSVSEGTKVIINQQKDMNVTVLTNSLEVMGHLEQTTYHVYLIDLYMPELNGLELMKMIREKEPESIILIYTGFDMETHYNLLMEAKVSGFLSKTATGDQIITAIRCALREEVVVPLCLLRQLKRVEVPVSVQDKEAPLVNIRLTEKEQAILREIEKGYTNKIIARNLIMSQRTVEHQLTKIFSKLGVESRMEAVQKAQEHQLLSVD